MTRTVTAGDLEVAFEEWGEADCVALLLHGFPDDATAWTGVAAALPSGIRAIAPYSRGVGPTRFRSSDIIRTGQLAARLYDTLTLLDALNLERVVLVGHDWGQRTAQAMAALHPERVSHLISLGDYALTFDRNGPFSLKQLWAFRFHLMANTLLARPVLEHWRAKFFKVLWRNWSPRAHFDEAAFRAVLPSFENPDFVELVLSTYRQQSGRGAKDERFAHDEHMLSAGPAIDVPSTIVRAALDGLDLFRQGSSPSAKFRNLAGCITLQAGHSPHRECPAEIARLIADVGCSLR